jgi:hypothetical protein
MFLSGLSTFKPGALKLSLDTSRSWQINLKRDERND